MSGASGSLTAYLLVTHGSRDRRPQDAMKTMTQRLQNSLKSDSRFPLNAPVLSRQKRDDYHKENQWEEGTSAASVRAHSANSVPVGAAVLELGPTPLRSQIVEFVEREQLPRGSRLRILPLFLLAGVHVMEDIPEEIAAVQMQLGDRLELEVLPYFGADPEHLVFLLRQAQVRFMEPVPQHWILLAHGSRRSQAVVKVEALAECLGMKTAYWVQKDSLRQRIIEAIGQWSEQGAGKGSGQGSESDSGLQPLVLGILPCFLFEGGLTDAIARQVLELGLEFPQVELRLGPTLSALPGFVEQVQGAMVGQSQN